MTAHELHEHRLTLTACLRVWERDIEPEDACFKALRRRIREVAQMEREAGRGEGAGCAT